MTKVYHVVLLKFREEEKVVPLFAALRALQHKIPAIASFSWGNNNSPEGLARGFTHAFVMTFKDAVSRDQYLAHPARYHYRAVLSTGWYAAYLVTGTTPNPIFTGWKSFGDSLCRICWSNKKICFG